MSPARTRLTVTVLTMAIAGLAVHHSTNIPGDLWLFVKTLLPILFGAGLSQWLLYPLLARKPGTLGWMLDVLVYALVVALAGVIAGTLFMPGAGTVLGLVVALSLPAQSPLSAILCAFGAVGTAALARRSEDQRQIRDRTTRPGSG